MKIAKKNQLKIVIFTAVKNRCLLHGRVFVMSTNLGSTVEQTMMAECSNAILQATLPMARRSWYQRSSLNGFHHSWGGGQLGHVIQNISGTIICFPNPWVLQIYFGFEFGFE